MRRLAASMLGIFSLTLFVSATLLFLVQPMIGKLILPLLGGSPAVWNTCMVFFQGILLAGYAYAHVSTEALGVRRQSLLHLGLLLLPFLILPVRLNESLLPSGETNPVGSVLLILFLGAGLPFFAVSASAPLLQRWFASTGHPSARDPYFLYAASNLGSMLALGAYPLLIEPGLKLETQTRAWTFGYAVLVALTALCAMLIRLAPSPARKAAAQPATAPEALTWGRRLRWVALAFVPSSWMLGVTTYVTTDIAAIPLLWVVPLAIYLLSFILVFGKTPVLVHQGFILALPVLVLLILYMTLSGNKPPDSFQVLDVTINGLYLTIGLHLLGLFVAAMVCHGELARNRPSTAHLTEFYLWMSVGGVLGGLCNALVAPVVFRTVLEYQLIMAVGCLMLPRFSNTAKPATWLTWTLDLVAPLLIGSLTYEFVRDLEDFRILLGNLKSHQGPDAHDYVQDLDSIIPWWRHKLNLGPIMIGRILTGLTYGIPAVLCYLLIDRPLRFGLAVGAFVVGTALSNASDNDLLLQARSFFGAVTVRYEGRDNDGQPHYTKLAHGTTLHGRQSLDPDRRREPLTYYHRTGPVGEIFAAFPGPAAKKNIAVVGLGTGTLACYGDAGMKLTFYEIDKLIRDIATNPSYFSYVTDCRDRGCDVNIVMGDARLQLKRASLAEADKYDLLLVDAFSSDAIPIHLITRQALEVYLSKMAPDGLIVFHISNRYLDLQPVLGNLVEQMTAEGTKLVAYVRDDNNDDPPGKTPSKWVVVARRDADLGTLQDSLSKDAKDDKPWREAKRDPSVGVWSDDYSNLWSVFQKK